MDNPDRLVVIFADSRPALAQLLLNRLREAGIEAFLENEALRQVAGDLPPGWDIAPRVVVAEHDLVDAQIIVAEFVGEEDRLTAESATALTDDLDDTDESDLHAEAMSIARARREIAEVADVRPRHAPHATCPHCNRPRLAECPYCHTSGNNFAAADRPARQGDDESVEELLLCPTCDEPFAPGYLRRCEWCGHDFGDGIVAAPVPSVEPVNARVVLVAVVTGLAIAAVLAWFGLLLR